MLLRTARTTGFALLALGIIWTGAAAASGEPTQVVANQVASASDGHGSTVEQSTSTKKKKKKDNGSGSDPDPRGS